MDNNEIVAVVGFDSANYSKAVTSCCRKDAQRYANLLDKERAEQTPYLFA